MDQEEFEPPAHDETTAQANAERETHFTTVQHLVAELEDVAAGIDVARAASFALSTVQSHALKQEGVRLSALDRDRLLTALMLARANIVDCVTTCRHGSQALPTVRAFTTSAVEAVCALVVMWAEQNPRSDRPRELIEDLIDRTKWLRNELHNISLEDQVRRRQSNRAKAVVDEMVSRGLQVNHA